MGVYIQNIDCRVPKTCYLQQSIKEIMKHLLKGGPKTNRYIDSIYNASEINQRYSCVSNPDDFFQVLDTGEILNPSTKMRNDLFTAEAGKLFVDTARSTIENCPNTDFSDITHLVTVSCTGFFNPGPDYAIIEELRLNKNVQRYNIGFMGCHAAFPALRWQIRLPAEPTLRFWLSRSSFAPHISLRRPRFHIGRRSFCRWQRA
jgi:predicted naringenin-chalcone synthase